MRHTRVIPSKQNTSGEITVTASRRFPERSNAPFFTFILSRAHLWPNWILDSHHSNADEVVDDLGLVVPLRQRIVREVAIRDTDRTEAVARHRLDHLLHHFVAISRSERTHRTALGQNGRTPTGREETHSGLLGDGNRGQNVLSEFNVSANVRLD